MSGLELLLVQATELLGAVRDMNKALETYNDAVEQCKTAANDLAAKWEGAAKEAFVSFEEDAYRWHHLILDVVRQMIDTIHKVIDLYENMENAVKNVVKG